MWVCVSKYTAYMFYCELLNWKASGWNLEKKVIIPTKIRNTKKNIYESFNMIYPGIRGLYVAAMQLNICSFYYTVIHASAIVYKLCSSRFSLVFLMIIDTVILLSFNYKTNFKIEFNLCLLQLFYCFVASNCGIYIIFKRIS